MDLPGGEKEASGVGVCQCNIDKCQVGGSHTAISGSSQMGANNGGGKGGLRKGRGFSSTET